MAKTQIICPKVMRTIEVANIEDNMIEPSGSFRLKLHKNLHAGSASAAAWMQSDVVPKRNRETAKRNDPAIHCCALIDVERLRLLSDSNGWIYITPEKFLIDEASRSDNLVRVFSDWVFEAIVPWAQCGRGILPS
jgi:hypothetical protein